MEDIHQSQEPQPPSDAQQALGEANETNWLSALSEHADMLPSEAAPLKRILQKEEIKDVIARYESTDALANQMQTHYKFYGHLQIVLFLLVTVTGGALFLPLESWFGAGSKWLLVMAQYFFLTMAIMISKLQSNNKFFEGWVSNRALAEIARVELFDKVFAASEKSSQKELPLLPLQLEYFRRHHLDVQRKYYQLRGEEHSRAIHRSAHWNLLRMAFILVWGSVASTAALLFLSMQHIISLPGFFEGLDIKTITSNLENPVLMIGLVVSALYSANTSRSLMNLDARNAMRYEVMARNLQDLTENYLPLARESARKNDKKAVLDFVSKVQEELSHEHREWMIIRPYMKPSMRGAFAPENG